MAPHVLKRLRAVVGAHCCASREVGNLTCGESVDMISSSLVAVGGWFAYIEKVFNRVCHS